MNKTTQQPTAPALHTPRSPFGSRILCLTADDACPVDNDNGKLICFRSYICDIGGVHTALTVSGDTEEETNQDARFIVQAANSHGRLTAQNAALRKALEELLTVSEMQPPSIHDDKAHTDYCLRIVAAEDEARAALAQAKGQPQT